jgi:hypothetical protein
MLLGKRKNNKSLFIIEPLPKRLKYNSFDYFLEIENLFNKIQNEHNKKCELEFKIVDSKIISTLIIYDYNQNEKINPYYLDLY